MQFNIGVSRRQQLGAWPTVRAPLIGCRLQSKSETRCSRMFSERQTRPVQSDLRMRCPYSALIGPLNHAENGGLKSEKDSSFFSFCGIVCLSDCCLDCKQPTGNERNRIEKEKTEGFLFFILFIICCFFGLFSLQSQDLNI